GDGKIGDRPPVLGTADFRILAQIADQNHFVDAACHRSSPLRFPQSPYPGTFRGSRLTRAAPALVPANMGLKCVLVMFLSLRGRTGKHFVPYFVAFQPILTSAAPSTGSATTLMKLASSEARNSAALATSQGVPIFLRSGTRASRIAATSARLLPEWRARVSTAIGVSIRPGKMTLTRIPNSAFWIAICCT